MIRTTTELYQLLELPEGVGIAEITRAARRMQRLNHPSLNPGDPDAAQRYAEINEAFEILTDPERRKENERRADPAPPPPSPRRVVREDPPLYVTIRLALIEAALGIVRRVRYEGAASCVQCGGEGCEQCSQVGWRPESREAEVTIPAGVESGSQIRISRTDGVVGEIVVVTSVTEHPFFNRLGNNIHCRVPVTIAEAALGAKIEVPTLQGRATLKIPPGTQSGQKLRLRERGMPSRLGAARGDLYVEIQVVTPQVRDARVRDLLAELSRHLERDGEKLRGRIWAEPVSEE